MIGWTSNQANQLASLLTPLNVPHNVTGIVAAIAVVFMLIGGIKRIGSIAEKLVPTMFVLYSSAMLWVIASNISLLPSTLILIVKSAFSTHGAGGAAIGFGMQRVFRWGLAKGLQANESGLGTSSIAHSAAETNNPIDQGILAMVAVYTNGLLCTLSGLAILMTGVWKDTSLVFDISMIDKVLSLYFPGVGSIVLVICGTLFSFTTIMGNSYYGMKCFSYLTNHRFELAHHFLVAAVIYIGAISDVRFIWSVVDFFMIPVAVINIIGLIVLSFKKSDLLKV